MQAEEKIILPPYDNKIVSEEIKDDEIDDIPGALELGEPVADPITFSVVLARLEGITPEVGTLL